jgi:hypothetical protein
MGFDLRNSAGETLKVSGGHWAVLLSLAGTYGWKPLGTRSPPGFPSIEKWHGRYDTNDGQTVTHADAKRLAEVLHAAVVSDTLHMALADVIRSIESQVVARGTHIPEQMRMKLMDFNDGFSALLLFLYQGEFIIE